MLPASFKEHTFFKSMLGVYFREHTFSKSILGAYFREHTFFKSMWGSISIHQKCPRMLQHVLPGYFFPSDFIFRGTFSAFLKNFKIFRATTAWHVFFSCDNSTTCFLPSDDGTAWFDGNFHKNRLLPKCFSHTIYVARNNHYYQLGGYICYFICEINVFIIFSLFQTNIWFICWS